MTIRELIAFRRKGITVVRLAKVAAQLKRDNALPDDDLGAAAAIARQMVAAGPELDFDQLLEFIMQLMPLILALLELFL